MKLSDAMGPTSKLKQYWRWLGICTVIALLQACATAVPVAASDPRDPFENMNRKVTGFNDVVDAAVLKPVAQTYAQIVPGFVRTGVRNFFGNLSDVWSLANNAAQLKFKATGDTALRVGINTFVGFGGLLDIASDLGVERHRSDFGLTLGHWGVQTGPYIVLPLLGPSTVRDAVALTIDRQGDLSRQSASSLKRDTALALKLVDTRESLLKILDALKEASLDPYTFTRDAYLQKRRNDQFDGNPPMQGSYDDPDEAQDGSPLPAK
ncbi:VacJ family lipoprotein [Limnohabitans sp. Rim8]|uniref:MlaA family lipoprotein n=1 Tax=Limnohabitans sp. Rim8 TaxID=1100718 RepID=UPI0026187A23|nr:VacJ family lipoprotein [Limnohabitans sp. Rim8]